jgi:hypothetical protein
MAEEQEYKYDIAPTDRRLDDALDAENAYQEKKEEGSGVEPIDPERLTTDQAEKGGPGDYSWGGYEDQKNNYGPIKPDNISQEAWDSKPEWTRPIEELLHAGALPALGVADFATDAIGLIPGLKPIDEWWDKNSPRYNHPAAKLTRDAASIIIPTLYGGTVLTGSARAATASMTLPNYVKTLGSVAAWTGVDTGVAAISSHSQTDDNLAGTLNNWLGWDIPWATRASDSPDVRYKKNVFEAAALSGSVELLGAAFAFGKKTKLIPRDVEAEQIIARRTAASSEYDNAVTEAVDSGRRAKEAAQNAEMEAAIKADPEGREYNAFVNNLGPDEAGRAVINTQPDPIMAKVNQAQIQNNIDTTFGRAAPVVDEAFNKKFLHAINGDDRAKQLDQLFNSISPNVDAVINGKTITAEQMNRAVDNLTNAMFGKDLPLREFEFIVDDMKSTVFNSNAFLDEEQWLIASKAFKNAYDTLFDPNQMRASAMLSQQAGDNVADAAAAVKMLGDQVDTTRQMNIIFDKMNLLGQEVGTNQYIVKKAKEYQRLKEAGNIEDVIRWMDQQGPAFDKYIREIKATGGKLNDTLKAIAKENPHFYKPFVEAYDATNGSVDELHKLHRLTEDNVGVLKKAIVDTNPKVPSMLIKQLHGARINGLLLGLAPARALLGNATMTALKPASIMAGALAQGDFKAFKRATWVFGGIEENFRRGLKVMKRDWDLAVKNPEEAMLRGRADLKQARMDQLEYMDSMADAWRAAKEPGWKGKYAMWQLTKAVSWWNKQQFVRWGTSALYAIDGMTNSFMASGMARARAYDSLAKDFNGSVNFNAFSKKQNELYSQAFDASGKLTDEAAKHASREIALNLDNEMVKAFDDFLEYVPAARGLFLFPRTGVNSVQLAWTFNPLSSAFNVALPKVKRTLRATTKAEKLDVLRNHGIEIADGLKLEEAFQSLKSEYIGRQIMGSTLVMGTGLWALQGNMTGNGPQDGAERARMLRMGWQPRSIKNPITGEWRSYEGFEPFASLMGLTSDVVYQMNRMDQAVGEDIFRKIAFAASMNVTNNTFVSGFKPLVDMLSGDPTAWNRFFAQQFDQTAIPFRGIRSILNNAISPGLRDVNNDFFSYMQNANKFLMPTGEEAALPELLDVFTGKPIKGYESITQAANALLPMFKQNGSMEPWRQWMLSTGWDGMTKLRTNKFTGQPLTAHERHFINNWIGKNANLKGQVIKLMTENDGYFQGKMKEYDRKLKGKVNIKEWVVHRELDLIIDRAYNGAWDALEAYNAEQGYSSQGRELKMLKHQMRQGNVSGASETQKRLKKLHQMAK